MSGLLNPLHPITIFIAKRLGKQVLDSVILTMPPNSSISFAFAPPIGSIWVHAVGVWGTPRDVATGNPVVNPGIYAVTEHEMIRTSVNYAIDSSFLQQWAGEVDETPNQPMVLTVVNGSALTIQWDITAAVIEIPERHHKTYDTLWNGLFNLLYILGQFDVETGETDEVVESIKKILNIEKKGK